MTREFSPNVVLFRDEGEYQWVTGSLKGIAARDPRLTPGGVYGYALKFATIDPDVRPENFVDFVQIELES